METSTLPQLTGNAIHLSDGGLETTLIFRDGVELPYFDLAEVAGTGFVLDTPTWRANPDWARRLGYDDEALAAANRRSVEYIRELAGTRPSVPMVLNGVIGPRGDGYAPRELMTAEEAAAYHALQVGALADAGAQMLSVLTMTYAAEAIGVVRAATAARVPSVVSFTVETDGRLPSGQSLGEAVLEVDDATEEGASYFTVNCAHPTHFLAVLAEGGSWLGRVKGVRANSSAKSHAELDETTELDRGDVAALAAHYAELRRLLPDLRVVGGCCGTDEAHVAAMVQELVP